MINCISNCTFYIDGLILFKCYFQENIKIIRITNDQLLLTFSIFCHSPLYPTSLTILLSESGPPVLNPASIGCQTLLRTVIPRGLSKVAPEDDTWKVLGKASLFLEHQCSKDGGELFIAVVICFFVLDGNGPIFFVMNFFFFFV